MDAIVDTDVGVRIAGLKLGRELSSTRKSNVLDLSVTLSQMTDIAGEFSARRPIGGRYATSTWRSGFEWTTTQTPALLPPP